MDGNQKEIGRTEIGRTEIGRTGIRRTERSTYRGGSHLKIFKLGGDELTALKRRTNEHL
jgi:hypothetical protein